PAHCPIAELGVVVFCGCDAVHQALHSFPTRRSSDLLRQAGRSLAIPAAESDVSGVGLVVCFSREASFPEPLVGSGRVDPTTVAQDRKSTRLNSSHLVISYAVFCLKKKKQHKFQPITQ